MNLLQINADKKKKNHSLQGNVAGTLADTQKRTVDGAGAVEPGGGRVGNGFIEVVMSVPLQKLTGHIGVMLQTVDDTRNASGQRRLGVGHAVAHGIAGTDLHRDARLPGEFLQLIYKRHDEAVKVRPGDVL